MMDGAVANNLEQATDQQIAIASEFGIKADSANRDWQIATNFVKQDNFASAAQLLMRGDLDPWQGGSLEQIIFWKGFNEWAIS
jgi:hypothetical protein